MLIASNVGVLASGCMFFIQTRGVFAKSSDICTTKIVVKVDNLGKIGETIK
jgi:hypothetical protein